MSTVEQLPLAPAGPATGEGLHASPRTSSLLVGLASFTARVTGNCPSLLDTLAGLYPVTSRRPLAATPRAQRRFEVREWQANGAGPRFDFVGLGGQKATYASLPEVISRLEDDLEEAAAIALGGDLLVHAGAVAAAGGAILLPGASGLGKSTMVAALSLAGFAYLTDEVAVVDREDLALIGFLKPIGLKRGGWQTLTASYAVAGAVEARQGGGATVRYFPAPRPCLDRVAVRHVVLLDRQAGKPASLAPVARVQAFMQVVEHSMNMPRHGRRGLEAFARLVESAACYRLTYWDLREAVAAISTLVGHQPDYGHRPAGGPATEL